MANVLCRKLKRLVLFGSGGCGVVVEVVVKAAKSCWSAGYVQSILEVWCGIGRETAVSSWRWEYSMVMGGGRGKGREEDEAVAPTAEREDVRGAVLRRGRSTLTWVLGRKCTALSNPSQMLLVVHR